MLIFKQHFVGQYRVTSLTLKYSAHSVLYPEMRHGAFSAFACVFYGSCRCYSPCLSHDSYFHGLQLMWPLGCVENAACTRLLKHYICSVIAILFSPPPCWAMVSRNIVLALLA